MTHEREQSFSPRPRSRRLDAVAWAAVVVAAPLCAAWVLGTWWYRFDILASEQLFIGLAVLFAAVVVGIPLRRRGAGAALLMLACLAMAPVATHRRWSLPRVDTAHKDAGALRVVSCNINPGNKLWKEDVQDLLGMDADVIVLLEVHPVLSRSVQKKDFLKGTGYSHWVIRPWVDSTTSQCYIISRWPMRLLEYGGDPGDAPYNLHAVLSRPGGDVVVGLMHPLSPRSPQRWVKGNATIELQAAEAARLHALTGLPVVMGADLNAGPAQVRARTLRRAGLRMTKPLLRPGGSFPAGGDLPAWLSPQIDDVWTLGDVRPIAWSMRRTLGSDHRAVVVDLRLGRR